MRFLTDAIQKLRFPNNSINSIITGFFLDKNDIFIHLKEIMITQFEIAPESISLKTKLNDDLDLDSLDMVDFIIILNNQLKGDKIEPTLFKDVCIVQDMVDRVQPYLK
jgi:acyl carrier protein